LSAPSSSIANTPLQLEEMESHPRATSFDAIRPVRASDVEPLRQLLVNTEVFNAEEVAIALELILAVVETPDHKDYLIRVYDDGAVLGYYCVGPTPATASTFDLYWIAVDPSVHGKGVGRLLIGHAEELIRSRGGTLVIAETSSTARYDKTRSFYIKAGYDEVSRIRDYYRAGDSLVVYGKYL
jgi:ribosomal protein S18 acetylase RimI-like enzyme